VHVRGRKAGVTVNGKGLRMLRRMVLQRLLW